MASEISFERLALREDHGTHQEPIAPMPTENAMNRAPMTNHRLGRTDFIHLAARPVRLSVDRGTLWVTQDGEPQDIEIDAGGQLDFDGHTRLTIGTLGGEAELRLVPLQKPRAATSLLGLQRWLGTLRAGAQA